MTAEERRRVERVVRQLGGTIPPSATNEELLVILESSVTRLNLGLARIVEALGWLGKG